MKQHLFKLAVALLLQTSTVNLDAAFCALRDPTASLNSLFPEADAHHSIVKKVDEATKRHLSSELPFTIHKRELGSHTVYLALKDKKALGLVHVRSEQSPWGIVEIAWAIDSSMKKTLSFEFQRCRDPAASDLRTETFHQLILDKDISELQSLLNEDGTSLKENYGLPNSSLQLASVVIRSAIKTLAVTQYVYLEEVKKASEMSSI